MQSQPLLPQCPIQTPYVCSTRHVGMQIVPAVNATMNALKAAGVVFVPFDSGDFTDAANIAWAGVPESDNYMEPEATARY